MPRRTKPLTAKEIEKAKPGIKPDYLFDGNGLYLEVSPGGGKWWRFKYRFNGKGKLISFGTYPEVSLGEAREKREAARKLVAKDVDPSSNRKALKAAKEEILANSFEVIAREWHQNMMRNKEWSADHATTIMNRLEKDVFPWLGRKPVTEISAKDVKTILDRVRSRGVVETARRVKTIMGQVFVYAISTDRANYDITAGLKQYLPATGRTRKHMAAVTNPHELAPLLRALDDYQGTFPVQCALKLVPLLFVRPGELRHMEWQEIDFSEDQWNIPAGKMKMRNPHVVPLSKQAIQILTELKALTGSGKYAFPSLRSKARCMSDNTINAAFRRMGFDKETVTGHGFRATARTILDEVLAVRVDIIEHQLAHSVKDPNGRAYNRTAFLPERKNMMQLWADYLDGLKNGAAKVIPIWSAEKEAI